MATAYLDPEMTPVMPAPAGVTSRLLNPPPHTSSTIICLTLALALSTPFVAVRMYTRQHVSRNLWWDDWTCLTGWLFFIAYCALTLQGLKYGGGSDLWNVSRADLMRFVALIHDIEIIGRVGMCLTKTSIILFYQRLFVPPGTRGTRIWWSIWFTFWGNLLYAVAFVLTVAFECVGKDALVAAGKQCVNRFALLVCASVINVTTDLMILFIPIAAVWRLQMPRGKKWRLSALFGIGTLGVLASVARLGYEISEISKPNKTVILIILLLMTAAEQFIGIVVSCMPLLPAFYRHVASEYTTAQNSGPSSLKNVLVASVLGPRSGSSKTPKDPYPLYSTKGYEELDDMEAQKRSADPPKSAGERH